MEHLTDDEYFIKQDNLAKAEKEYFEVEKPKVKKLIEEFIQENIRMKMTIGEQIDSKKKILKKIKSDIGLIGFRKSLRKEIMELEKKKRLTINPEMIERARQADIKNIVEVDSRLFAKCLDHDDKTASMYCKGGFAYCFTCGYKADTIALYRKVHNCTFPEAVVALQTM